MAELAVRLEEHRGAIPVCRLKLRLTVGGKVRIDNPLQAVIMAIAPWRSRAVFVTSTFADMQREWDHLQNVVFPALQERLRERRHHLQPVDLRWVVEMLSVDQQHQKELLGTNPDSLEMRT